MLNKLFIGFIIFFSCNSKFENETLDYLKIMKNIISINTKYDEIIDSSYLNNNVQLHFTSKFNENRIKIYNNDFQFTNEILTTNRVTGFTYKQIFEIKDFKKFDVKVKIDDYEEFQIQINPYYQYIAVKFNENTNNVNLWYTNRNIAYY